MIFFIKICKLNHIKYITACDNCSQTLLDSVEELTSRLRHNVDPAELERIPKPFLALKEFEQNATTLQNEFVMLKLEMSKSKDVEHALRELRDTERRVYSDAKELNVEGSRRQKEAEYLSLESMSALEEVLKQRRRLGEQVAALEEFATGERHMSAHRALKEAWQMLKHIKEMKLNDYVTGANDVFDHS